MGLLTAEPLGVWVVDLKIWAEKVVDGHLLLQRQAVILTCWRKTTSQLSISISISIRISDVLLRKLAGQAVSVHHVAKPPTTPQQCRHAIIFRAAEKQERESPSIAGTSDHVSLPRRRKIKMRLQLTAEPQVEQTIPLCRGNKRYTDGWQLEVVVQNVTFADSSTILETCCIHCQMAFSLCVCFFSSWLIINATIWWLFVVKTFPPALQLVTGLRWNLVTKLLSFGMRNSCSTQSKCYVWRCANLTNGYRHYCIIVSIKEA